MIRPERSEEEIVVFESCLQGYACLDANGMQSLIKNIINSEVYIEQLENLLNSLTEPVAPAEKAKK